MCCFYINSRSSPMFPPLLLSLLALMSPLLLHSKWSQALHTLCSKQFFLMYLAQVFFTMSIYRELRESTHISRSYRLERLPCSLLSPTHMLMMCFCLSWHATKNMFRELAKLTVSLTNGSEPPVSTECHQQTSP